MVLLGIMTILFYLIPAVNIYVDNAYNTDINLFTATFGGGFTIYDQAQPLVACGGLITAFVLGVVAIILTMLKCKIKFATLLACPFYIASGVLVACTSQLVSAANLNVGIAPQFSFNILGGAITVATFFCILGFFALIDFIAAVAKPKQQPSAY